MSYFQLIEVKTTRYDDLMKLHEVWRSETEGERTAIRQWICRDRDRADTYMFIVEFPSADAAAVNNELPATGRIAARMAELTSSPPSFRNLDVLRHD